MSIISSEIVEDSLQAHDRRRIREKHTDHLGVIHLRAGEIGMGVDAVANMNARVAGIEENLANVEIDKYVQMAEEGIEIDPTIVPDHTTKANILKALIKQAFLWAGHTIAFSVIATIDSLTDIQIKNTVGITQAKVDKIRNRVINLKLIRTAVNDDLLDIEEPE